MESLQKELRDYAKELATHQTYAYTQDEYFALLTEMYASTVRHHGEETVAQMSDTVLLKVIKSQMIELIRLKRLPKLMKKRDHIL